MVANTMCNWGRSAMAMDIRAHSGFGTAMLIRPGLSARKGQIRDFGFLPASQSTSMCASRSATTTATRGRQPIAAQATLFEAAQNINVIGLEEAEKLYTSLPDRSNSKHVMLIMHAPWCSHCKAMEPQVRLLAAGLAAKSADLSILALECNSAATSAFVKEVLGVPTLPAFCIFPRNSRTFYKFKGQTRDAQSLLKFLNMVCNQHEEKLWELPEAAVAATTSTSRPAPIMSVSTPSVLDAAPAAAWGRNSPISLAVMAAGLAAGVCLLVGAKLLASKQQKEEGATGSRSAAGSPSALPTTGAAGLQEKRPLEHLLHDIDSSLGRLFSVMLRLMRARVGLVISRVDGPAPGAAPDSKQQPVVDVEAREVPGSTASNGSAGVPAQPLPPAALGPSTSVGTGGVRRGGATVGAAMAMPSISTSDLAAAASTQLANTAAQVEGASASEDPDWLVAVDYALDEELRAPLDVDSADLGCSPGGKAGLDLSGLTHEVVNVSGVSADQVLSMLAEEGEDVGKVLQRLLQQQEVQFKVEAVPPHSGNPSDP